MEDLINLLKEISKGEYISFFDYSKYLIDDSGYGMYIDKVSYTNDYCSYSPVNKRLSINLNDVYFLNNKNFTEEENRLFSYFYLTYLIYHEINHIKQYNLIDCHNKLDEYFCKSEFKLSRYYNRLNNKYLEQFKKYTYYLIIEKGRSYVTYYDYCPIERMADIDALIDILKITNKLNYQNIFEFFNKILIEVYLNKYDKVLSPTKYYYENLKKYDMLVKLKMLEFHYDYLERARLGVFISEEEQELIRKNSIKIN